MLEPLSELLRKSRRETMRNRATQRAINGHQAILEAIIAKNPDKAGEAMRLHLEKAQEDLGSTQELGDLSKR